MNTERTLDDVEVSTFWHCSQEKTWTLRHVTSSNALRRAINPGAPSFAQDVR